MCPLGISTLKLFGTVKMKSIKKTTGHNLTRGRQNYNATNRDPEANAIAEYS